MISLVYKDLTNLKQQAKIYFVIIAVWVVVALTQKSPEFLGGVLSVFAVLVAITAYAYDEKAGWDKYALTMPVGRREIVLSKYILSCLVLGCGMLLFVVLNIVLHTRPEEFWPLTCTFLAVGLLALEVILPVIFQFGVEKGRIIIMLIFLLPSIIAMVADGIYLPVAPFLLMEHSHLFAVALGMILFPVSVAISYRVYAKKEF